MTDAEPELVAIGAAAIDHVYELTNLPEPDGGAYVRDETRTHGGAGGNVATACTRLGRDAGLVTRLGDDSDADRIEHALDDAGIDRERVRRGAERSTYCMVLRNPDGERMLVAGGDGVATLELTDADLDYCRSADAVYANAYAPDSVVRRLADARRSGAVPPVAFDLSAPLAELQNRGTTRETLDDALPVFDLVTTSEVPASSYFGVGPEAAATALADMGVERGAVTRGEDGALLVADGDVIEIPAVEVDAVDTTGAGDAFAAGLIHAWLLGGREPEDAGRFASVVAACNCRESGARGGLPTAEEARALLNY